jgi:hypothetical protein
MATSTTNGASTKKKNSKQQPTLPNVGTTSVIEIDGLGLVTHRTIPIPEKGCVVVLKGKNGSGKTTCLNAVRTRLGMKVTSLTANDSLGTGYVEAFGGRTTIAKQVRHSGARPEELEVVHIEDRFDLSTIVDPGLIDPEAADAKRLLALVQITGASVPFERFRELIPKAATDLVDAEALAAAEEAGDLVTINAMFKRAVQQAALRQEKDAKAKADAARTQQDMANAGNLDLTQEWDREELQRDVEAALKRHTSLDEQRRSAERQSQAAKAAQEELEKLKVHRAATGLSLDAEKAVLARTAEEVTGFQDLVKAAEASLQLAKEQLAEAESRRKMAEQRVLRAEETEASIAALQDTVTLNTIAGPSQEELDKSLQDLTVARERESVGYKIRQAQEIKASADKLAKEASGIAAVAASLRTAADQADGLLSAAVKIDGLRFSGGRWLVKRDEREEPFARLSVGERWTEAIRIGAKAVGEAEGDGTRLLILDQDAWQDLDPGNRDHVADLAEMYGVTILTAECSDGELRAEIYGQAA